MNEPIYDNYRTKRTLLNRHGVLIEAVQSGTIRQFDWTALILQLATSLALMTVATIITDKVALYVLPDAKAYGAICRYLIFVLKIIPDKHVLR